MVHVAECDDYPVGCQRKCDKGKHIKRKQVGEHAKVCPVEPVKCVFFDSGCLTTLPRKDIAEFEHMESNARVHLLYCLGAQQKLAEKLSELKLSHEKLQDDHQSLKEECQQMKSSVSGILDSHVQQQCASSTNACASCQSTTSFTMRCIKTALFPNLCYANPQTFRVHHDCDREWTSPIFTLDGEYRMVIHLNYYSRGNVRVSLCSLEQGSDDGFVMPNGVITSRNIHIGLSPGDNENPFAVDDDSILKFCSVCNGNYRLKRSCGINIHGGNMRLVDMMTGPTSLPSLAGLEIMHYNIEQSHMHSVSFLVLLLLYITNRRSSFHLRHCNLTRLEFNCLIFRLVIIYYMYACTIIFVHLS